MNQLSLLALAFSLLATDALSKQAAPDRGSITGRVLDASTRLPVEYANIFLYTRGDSAFVTGTATNSEGMFRLENIASGDYFIQVRFLAYKVHIVGSVIVNERPVRLNDILLSPSSITLSDVVVKGERPGLTYSIDKKVIDVGQLSTTISGTAAEVLASVPSVTLDIEGNVSLRGSSSFTVLVDGKPSVLDAQDALQQIAASTIERIEIITNPSAKYDPEGSAGIINIIMKKQRESGWSGLANANVGLKDKYGGDLLFEHKEETVSSVVGLDYNNRMSPGRSTEEERYVNSSGSSIVRSSGDVRMLRNTFGLRGTLEFKIGEQGTGTGSARYGTREWSNSSTLRHEAFSELSLQPEISQNILYRKRGGSFGAFNTGYQHDFGPNGHKLTGDIMFRYNDSDELTTSELLNDIQPPSGRKTTEAGPSRDLNTRLEYVHPFNEASKFDVGYDGEIDFSEEATTLSDYDSLRQYVLLPQFSNQVENRDHKHALYSLYSGEIDRLGYQAGFRTELTRRSIRLARGTEFLISRWDYFPTIHLSYTFSDATQAMASYARRISRPRGWQLEPFETWIDANNVRRGNPSLLPELIDSYELGTQTLIGKTSLSLELYHRVSHNKIDDIRSVYAENVSLTTFDNVGTERSSGAEFLANLDVMKGWNLNLVGNAYNYQISGTLFAAPFSVQSFNWSARMNNLVKFGSSTQLQLNAIWNSPSVSSQGTRKAFFSVDVAAKQEFMNRQLTLTLQIQNLLNTARHEYTSGGRRFSSYRLREMESPVVMLTARISINNYRPERERGGEGFGNDEF